MVGAGHRQLAECAGSTQAEQVGQRLDGGQLPAVDAGQYARHGRGHAAEVKHHAPAGFAQLREFAHLQICPAGTHAGNQADEAGKLLLGGNGGLEQDDDAAKTHQERGQHQRGNSFLKEDEGKQGQKQRRSVIERDGGGQRQAGEREERKQERHRAGDAAVEMRFQIGRAEGLVAPPFRQPDRHQSKQHAPKHQLVKTEAETAAGGFGKRAHQGKQGG